MAIEVKVEEQKKAEVAASVWTHSAPEPLKRNGAPSNEELVEDLKNKIAAVLSPWENRVVDSIAVETMRLDVQRQSHLIRTIAISAVDDELTAVVTVAVRGFTQDLTSSFPVKTMDPAVATTQDEDDGGQPKPARMRGGKSTTGIQGSNPFAEPPESK